MRNRLLTTAAALLLGATLVVGAVPAVRWTIFPPAEDRLIPELPFTKVHVDWTEPLHVWGKGIGDIDECKKSYRRALALDPDYTAAMFNLGAIYWNHGPKDEAARMWRVVLTRFPSHPLAQKLRQDFSQIIGFIDNE